MAIPGFVPGKLLRIFVDEEDRVGMQPTYCAIVDFLRRHGVAGATVFRGIEGYGGHNQVHIAKVFAWVQNMPILIEVVDDWERLEPLLPELQNLVGEGLLTLEAVDYLRLMRAKTNQRDKDSHR
ncbi:MAG: DUF190 domain-containing protein [Vulcanimicrobiaceae bacterium]